MPTSKNGLKKGKVRREKGRRRGRERERGKRGLYLLVGYLHLLLLGPVGHYHCSWLSLSLSFLAGLLNSDLLSIPSNCTRDSTHVLTLDRR